MCRTRRLSSLMPICSGKHRNIIRGITQAMAIWARSSLILLVVLASTLFVHSATGLGRPTPILSQPFGTGAHKTYWLTGGAMTNWNYSGTNPGPLIRANDGDNITMMLRSADTFTPHSWFLDFNDNLAIDSNEVFTRSPDFSSQSAWTSFNFTASLKAGIPHGGNFTYRCAQHPGFMFGTFEFYAGPVAAFSHSPQTPLVAKKVTFDGSASWPTTGARITNYRWDFGDSNITSSGGSASITHVYAANKTYAVTLNITDNWSPPQTARATGNVTVLSPPPVPFDYHIATSPANATSFAGQSTTVLVNLRLVSGKAENVTLSVLHSPVDLVVQVSPTNVTSGFPPFPARFSISTIPSSFCFPDPCILSKTYIITIVAVTNTGVDHNATFTLVLKPTPPPSTQPNYPLFFGIAAVAGLAVLAVFLVFRRRKKQRVGSGTQVGT